MNESLSCPKCGAVLPGTGICATCAANFLQGEPTVAPGEPFVPPTVTELAEKFPQLEIFELIGKGGMGAVYRARQRELDRIVALKILPPGIGDDPAFAERFAREARALAKLSHPNIVTLFEFGRAEDGPYFFLMEFVDGVNLRQLLHAERISPREALEIVPQICDALQFAHDHGIVHRDIKPENILLDRRGRVKVADFGLAKLIGSGVETEGEGTTASADLTGAGKILGTPSYMAPEQTARPDAVDHRADIYALGVVFYQMLTGELPEKQIQPPSHKVCIDVRLDEVVLRALEKEPKLRWQQASILKTQVETVSAETDGNLRTEPQIENPESGKQKSNIVPRFSRMAIVGACWPFLVFGILVLLASPLTGLETDPAIQLAIILSVIGTTNFGWIAVSQIRDSAGRLHGMWLAVLEGLLPPLLALDGFIIVGLHRRIGIENIANTLTGQMGPGQDATLYVTVYNSLVLLTLAVVIGANGMIVRKVWRAVNSTAPFDGKSMAYTALVFGILSNLIPVIFYWNAKASPWITPQIQQAMLGLALVVAALAVILGNLSRSSRAGWTALVLGGVSLTIWMLCFISGLVSARQSGWAVRDMEELDDIAIAAAAHPGHSGNARVFGPVIERMVDKDGMIDFDTGRIAAELPESVTKANDLAENVLDAFAWMAHEGMDAMSMQGGLLSENGFKGLDLKIKPLDLAAWDQLTPEQLQAILAAAKMERWQSLLPDKKIPQTCAFQTREGGMGILQVTGFAENPTSVKLRYKLLQTAKATSPSAPLPAVQSWLALMDGGRYAQAWQEAAESFHQAVTQDEWVAKSRDIREPLGKVISRKMTSSQQTVTMPGMPDGTYFVAEFQTSFADFPAATETVAFALEPSGGWQAISYLILPRAEAADKPTAPAPPKTDAERAAVAAAESWLAGIDAGKYAESWLVATGLFRAAVTQPQWVAALESVRAPLGTVVRRALRSARTETSLPGAPDGQYVVMQFDTSFTDKRAAIETVTFALAKDGQWQATGYFIK